MGVVHPGPRNPNWRGGRTVASSGYVLVRRPGHRLADVRGYVYEHRLVAEEKLGRALRRGEQIHHLNHDRADNRPDNIEVEPTPAHHRRKHRKHERGLREPGQQNEPAACECGCGTTFDRFDASGRPRRFVSGHNLGVRRVRRG
jgi:hypothetical protein